MSSQRIAYPDDPLMAAAWLSAITVAATTPDVVAAHETARGTRFLLAGRRSPIEAMVDKATGADLASVEDFVDWFNEEVWGDDPFVVEEP